MTYLPPFSFAEALAGPSERGSEPLAEGRDRRMCVRIDDNVEEQGRARLQGGFEPRREIARVLDADAGAAAGLRDRRMIDRQELAGVRIGVEHHGLAVLLIAEDLIVQDDEDDRQPVANDRLKLGPAMAEAAVARDAQHGAVGLGKL